MTECSVAQHATKNAWQVRNRMKNNNVRGVSIIISKVFLVACHATLHPALSVRRSVRPSVRHTLLFFLFFLRSLASLLLPKWSSDLKNSPCPPTRDWGSRVSGLVATYLGNTYTYDIPGGMSKEIEGTAAKCNANTNARHLNTFSISTIVDVSNNERDCFHWTRLQREHIFMNFHHPTREWAKWASPWSREQSEQAKQA